MHDRSAADLTIEQARGANDGAAPDGALLPPRYRCVGEVGRGGMGVVWRVVDVDLDRPLAVKVMQEPPDAARQERFVAEARITGRLQHPGIPPVHEVGRTADGRPFFSMKLIEGHTLSDLLRAREVPEADRPRFLKVFEQVCQTVAYAHSQGIIHRDLKPVNVMVGAFGEVQVMDWGLAKTIRIDNGSQTARDSAETRPALSQGEPPPAAGEFTVDWGSGTPDERTVAGQVLGTLAYMPPEQANGRLDQLDERADVFGLGALLCEVLTGQPPYTARNTTELLRRARAGDLADAFARLDHCGADAALVALAKAYLAPDPSARPRDAQVVAGQVTAYLNSVQEQLRQAEVGRAAAQARAGAERNKRRWQLALAGVLVLSLLAAGAVGLWYVQDQAARSRHRELLAADLAKQLDDLEGQRRRLHERLADRRQAHDLLSDIGGWKTQVDRMGDAWQRADAIRRAGAGLLDDGAAGEVARQGELLRADAEDWNVARQLDGIRLEAGVRIEGKLDSSRAARKYPGVFSALGIDVENSPPEQAAEQVRESLIRQALVAALDHWAAAMPGKASRLLDVARRVDPDPWGDRVRDPATWGDRDRLLALAREGVPDEASPQLVLLLAWKVNAHDSRAAAALVRQAVLAQPRDFWLHYDLGNLVKDAGEKVGSLQAAMALRPESAIAHYNLGYALYLKSDLDGAARCYRKSLELDPNYPQGHNALGVVLRDQKDTAGAMKCFEKALELDPDLAAAHHNIGWILFLQKDYEGATARFKKALALDPGLALIHNGLGGALLAQRDVDGAIRCFRKAIDLEPELALAHYNLGAALQRQAKFADALASFRKAEELGPRGPGWEAPAAEGARMCERFIELERKLPDVVAGTVKPKSAAEQLDLGRLCKIKEMYAQAARFYEAALAADPTLAVGWARYDGACHAILAATGQGADAAALDEKEKARLRGFALDSLRTEMAGFRKQLEADPKKADDVKSKLRHWQNDSDLIGVREEKERAKLPPAERAAWERLWADVAALLQKG
jgi:tetratricopeptide (TPR) repeat protein